MTYTVGIDLAAESSKTGACVVEWDAGRATVTDVIVGSRARPLENADLVELLDAAPAAGIDAPFGWPVAFLRAVVAWSENAKWGVPWTPESRRELRLRETDRWIAGREHQRAPLSVSADSIAVCALRAATVLSTLKPAGNIDRIHGPTYEVYPGAALREWQFDTTKYKSDVDARRRLLGDIIDGDWLDLGSFGDELVRTDHALDALVSAIVARAAELGKVHPVPFDLVAAARVEGWIHLPNVQPAELVTATPD